MLLGELSLEEQNDVKVRDKIFEKVVEEDGHGQALCMGVGIHLAPKRSKVTSSSSHYYEVELERLR